MGGQLSRNEGWVEARAGVVMWKKTRAMEGGRVGFYLGSSSPCIRLHRPQSGSCATDFCDGARARSFLDWLNAAWDVLISGQSRCCPPLVIWGHSCRESVDTWTLTVSSHTLMFSSEAGWSLIPIPRVIFYLSVGVEGIYSIGFCTLPRTLREI